MPASEPQRQIYRDLFRSQHNTEFQAWFEKLARELHPAGDFQPIRQTSGDGGLDGFAISSKLVYQVHAPARIGELRDAEMARKIRSDFQSAAATLKGQLESWVFVHNHPEAKIGQLTAAALSELNTANPAVAVRVLDIDSLWQLLRDLQDSVIERLFGPACPQTFPAEPREGISQPIARSSVLRWEVPLGVDIQAAVNLASGRSVPGPSPDASRASDLLERALATKMLHSGVEAAAVAPRACEPPPIPNPHIARAAALNALAHALMPQNIAAVFGYAKSGKTTLVADFVRTYPGAGIWVSVQRPSQSDDDWWNTTLVQIALRLGLSEAGGPSVRDGLLAESEQNRLIIAIDDAHLLSNLDGMVWIEQAIAASNARISLILVGVDEPSFIERVRSRGIESWRIPGFTQSECRDWFSKAISEPSTGQLVALDALRDRTDGHPGMLRLCANSVQQVRDEEQAARFIAELQAGLGTGPDAFHATLFQAFNSHLNEAENEICRRLSVAFHSFSRRLAEALWKVGNETADFATVWDSCLLRILDPVDQVRHQLPVLYRDGLRQRTTPSEREVWHDVAQQLLSTPVDGGLDIIDAGDAVEHAILANHAASAVELAARFLLAAGGRYHREACRILLARFERLFARKIDFTQLGRPTLLRWHAARTNTYRELKQLRRATATASELYAMLNSAERDASSPASQLAWSILLVHSVVIGRTAWAVDAATHLSASMTPEWRRLGLLFAYLRSDSPPTDGMRFLLQDASGGVLHLWDADFGFEFWRSVGMHFCAFLDQNGNSQSIQDALSVHGELVDAAVRNGELDIARMALASRSRIEIDYARDFEAALQTANELAALGDSANREVTAFSYHVIGNARRCAGEEHAADAYNYALTQWPADRTAERAESTLMLAVCLGREGAHHRAYETALDAAALYSQDGSSWSPINVAHAYFEAATVALRGMGLTKALRPLIRAFAVLSDNHRNSPEWVVLAQLAMQVSSRLDNRENDLQSPVPGFTIGIRQSDASSGMNPSAPALLLGRACTLAGFPHRALSYFDEVRRDSDQPVTGWGVAMYAMDAAIDARNLFRATLYCAMLARALEEEPTLFVEHKEEEFVQFQIARVVSLAIERAGAEGATALTQALSAPSSTTPTAGSASDALYVALGALAACFEDGADDQLDEAVATAVRHKNLRVVRDLAWYWCFRFSVGRSVSEGEFFIWHWRLLWVTIEVGGNDDAFFSTFRAQLHGWWSHLTTTLADSDFAPVRDALASHEDAKHCLLETRPLLNRLLIKNAGIHAICRAVSEALASSVDASWLEPLRQHTVAGLLQLVLSPIARDYLDAIDADICQLEQSLVAGYASDQYGDWNSDCQALRLLVGNLQKQDIQANTTASLLRFASLVTTMEMETSAANYYVWLRHTLNSEPLNRERLAEVQAILASDHAATLLRSSTMPTYLRHRLAEVHCAAVLHPAITRLMQAVAQRATQSQLGFSVSDAARRHAAEEYDGALAAATTALNELDGLVTELRDADKPLDLARGLAEVGGGRKLLGGVLLRHSDGAEHGWQLVREADRDLEEALRVLATTSDPEAMRIRLRTAFERLVVASALKDQPTVNGLQELIDQFRERPDFQSDVKSLEELHARDFLRAPQEVDEREASHILADEKAIQDFTELNMRAMGLPEDRRRYVEDDVRKFAKSMEIQRNFCRHLQPLQNLEHTRSPETAYTQLTKYTCECTLLGHRTRIETDDVDVAIAAMQRSYCDGCSKRAPLENTPP